MGWFSDRLLDKPLEVFEPDGGEGIRGAVLFLHGYDGLTLRDNLSYTSQLQQHRLTCVCPLGPQCWWTDRVFPLFDPSISPVDFLATHIPEYCRQRWSLEPSRIGVCGVEMGGQGALQLVYRRARQFPVVVAVSPIIDFETWHGHGTSLDEMFPTRETARQATAILHIHPLDWPKHQLLLCDPEDRYCFEGVMKLVSKLSSSGVPFESDFQTTHGGFGWNYANAIAPVAIGFLAAHLATP